MNRGMVIRMLCAMTMLLCCIACHRRPLTDPEGAAKVYVTVKTDGIQNVTCDIYNEDLPVPEIDPEMIRVAFFNVDDDRVVTEKYISNRSINENGETVISGNMIIAPGTYGMLCYNFDTESTMIRNPNSWNGIEAWTGKVNGGIYNSLSSASKADEEKIDILNEPDYLVVARDDARKVPYHSGLHEIWVDAFPVVCTYYLQIRVKGAEYISAAQAVVTGLSPSNFIARNEMVTDRTAGTYFSLIKSRDGIDDVVCGLFSTFGKVEDAVSNLTVTVDVRKPDGTLQAATYDITDLFFTEDGLKHHWLFVEDILEVDPPATGGGAGGGFTPSVGDWEEEHKDIPL